VLEYQKRTSVICHTLNLDSSFMGNDSGIQDNVEKHKFLSISVHSPHYMFTRSLTTRKNMLFQRRVKHILQSVKWHLRADSCDWTSADVQMIWGSEIEPCTGRIIDVNKTVNLYWQTDAFFQLQNLLWKGQSDTNWKKEINLKGTDTVYI